VVAELDQPAHRLVVSDHGDRAIALARRGSVWRLARLDFGNRRAEPWCDARLEAFATDYDGALWFVSGPDGLLAAETAAAGLEGSWGVSRLPGPLLSIARDAGGPGQPGHCSLLFADEEEEGHELWTYELPSLTLRRRDAVPPAPDHRRSHPVAVSPEGTIAEALGGTGRRLALHVNGATISLPGPGRPGDPAVAGEWAALPVHTTEAFVVYLVHLPGAAVRAEVALGRTARATLRLTPHCLTVADDRGRVVVLDLEFGQVRRDFRL